MNTKINNKICFIAVCLAVNLTACSNAQHQVIAATGTVIGLEISENMATQTANAKLGYNRSELAIVPTNRSTCAKAKKTGEPVCSPEYGGGAKDTTDVLMELRYKSNLTLKGDAGIYQRLAVGSNAVKQPGATLMFSKDEAGNIDKNTSKYIVQAENEIKKEQDHLSKIVNYVSSSAGNVDPAKLNTLIESAKTNVTIQTPTS